MPRDTTTASRWIVETNHPPQHHPDPHHLRLLSESVVCPLSSYFFFLCPFIEIPFKCLRRSSSSCCSLAMIAIIIINNLCCSVCVWSAFVAQTGRQAEEETGRNTRLQLLFPLFGFLLLRGNLFDCLFIFPSPDLKSKFMFAIKTRSATPSHN